MIRHPPRSPPFPPPPLFRSVLAARLPLHLVPLDATRQAVLPRAGIKSALRRATGPLAERIVAFTERGFRIDHASGAGDDALGRSEEHTSELQSQSNLVCRLL